MVLVWFLKYAGWLCFWVVFLFGWGCVLISILVSFVGNFGEDDGYWVRPGIERLKIVHFLGLIIEPSMASAE